MIFNESNVKVVRENGYLTKYAGKKAPYFPFTEEDVKNNIILLIDTAYYKSRIYYLTNYDNGVADFTGFSSTVVNRLSFDFKTMNISSVNYPWATGVAN